MGASRQSCIHLSKENRSFSYRVLSMTPNSLSPEDREILAKGEIPPGVFLFLVLLFLLLGCFDVWCSVFGVWCLFVLYLPFGFLVSHFGCSPCLICLQIQRINPLKIARCFLKNSRKTALEQLMTPQKEQTFLI